MLNAMSISLSLLQLPVVLLEFSMKDELENGCPKNRYFLSSADSSFYYRMLQQWLRKRMITRTVRRTWFFACSSVVVRLESDTFKCLTALTMTKNFKKTVSLKCSCSAYSPARFTIEATKDERKNRESASVETYSDTQSDGEPEATISSSVLPNYGFLQRKAIWHFETIDCLPSENFIVNRIDVFESFNMRKQSRRFSISRPVKLWKEDGRILKKCSEKMKT